MADPSPLNRLLLAAALFCIGWATGCGEPKPGPAITHWPKGKPEAWRLVTGDPSVETPALLSNGLIGLRISRLASGWGAGKSLPCHTWAHYQTAGEEKIETVPSPLGVEWTVEGTPVTVDRLVAYEQALDLQSGVLRTTFVMDVRPRVRVSFACNQAIDPKRAVVAERWEVWSPEAVRIEGRSRLPGEPGLGSEEGVRYDLAEGGAWLIGTKTEPTVPGETANGVQTFRWDTERAVVERVSRLDAGGRYVALLRATGRREVARSEVPQVPPATDFANVVAASANYWREAWDTDIVIDGPVEDQQAVRSFVFYLRAALSGDPPINLGLSPLGLSGQTYNGHVFWDSDVWVFPALALLAPDEAARLVRYRTERIGAAEAEWRVWRKAQAQKPFAGGLKYPWESSVTGREVALGESRSQHHITGSVAWAVEAANALGLASDADAARIGKGAATFFEARSEQRPDGTWGINDVMSPDEFKIGSNDLYTNLLAERFSSRYGEGRRFHRPRDATSLLTYDEDPLRTYKQAAAVLAIYPLQDPEAESQAAAMMDRFEGKVTANGPAMTDSVHALIRARLGETKRAYQTWHKSWEDFTGHPLLLFSEKRKKEVTYFSTGAGGCLQTVLYGFLGFRLDSRKDANAPWAKELNGGHWLSLKPNLPPNWKRVVFKNFTVRGERFTVVVDAAGPKVTQELTTNHAQRRHHG
ncbi:MAG: glycoside hydrolase family 65 protein [Fimbriimonadaceae bacterium]|nr:glycoside hydrolase family 65 protein [Fimbriimonadaceae bacterium]